MPGLKLQLAIAQFVPEQSAFGQRDRDEDPAGRLLQVHVPW